MRESILYSDGRVDKHLLEHKKTVQKYTNNAGNTELYSCYNKCKCVFCSPHKPLITLLNI